MLIPLPEIERRRAVPRSEVHATGHVKAFLTNAGRKSPFPSYFDAVKQEIPERQHHSNFLNTDKTFTFETWYQQVPNVGTKRFLKIKRSVYSGC